MGSYLRIVQDVRVFGLIDTQTSYKETSENDPSIDEMLAKRERKFSKEKKKRRSETTKGNRGLCIEECVEGCFIAVRSITRGLGSYCEVRILLRLDAPFSARSSEIDETKVARNSLKDRHSRRTTDLNSIDNRSSFFLHEKNRGRRREFYSKNSMLTNTKNDRLGKNFVSRDNSKKLVRIVSILSRGDVEYILCVKQRMKEKRNCDGELGKRAEGIKINRLETRMRIRGPYSRRLTLPFKQKSHGVYVLHMHITHRGSFGIREFRVYAICRITRTWEKRGFFFDRTTRDEQRLNSNIFPFPSAISSSFNAVTYFLHACLYLKTWTIIQKVSKLRNCGSTIIFKIYVKIFLSSEKD